MPQKEKIFYWFFIIFFLLNFKNTFAQECPVNIGFETGQFTNWQCDSGRVLQNGDMELNPTGPLPGIHTMLQNTVPQQRDPFGDFPVNCPNGSGYSIQLGNSHTGAKAEAVSYTFVVPQNVQDYSIIYNYAVVLQNPNHIEHQQPKFQSRIFDVTDGRYIDCGSFQFVASPDLPGFLLSPQARDVFYKPWAPITINLFGYAGKTIRLEFTTNDCTLGGHFGYAYLDVNENCTSPISGNIYCEDAKSTTLTAPYGFKEYRWYTSDFSTVIGTSNILKITPPPPPNTKYALEVIPFPGLGCLDTLETTIKSVREVFELQVADSLPGCHTGVDLTANHITQGSTPNIRYTYFIDENQLNYVPTPTAVQSTGVYYIKGVNPSGCSDMKPIQVIIKDPPKINIADPPPACFPNTVDITSATITRGSDPDLTYSYWQTPDTLRRLTNPTTIPNTGTYYIRGFAPYGCAEVKPVNVVVGTLPNIKINSVTGCDKVDLSSSIDRSLSSPGSVYTFWEDAATTRSIGNLVKVSGTFYVKATNQSGCSSVAEVKATVNPNPIFTVTKPAAVTYPATIDLTKQVPGVNLSFSYWSNASATTLINQPRAINTGGTYYIKAINEFGCSSINPIEVVINPPPLPTIISPNAFSPNGDGINDVFKMEIDGIVNVKDFRIYNRAGQLLFQTADITRSWDGKWNGKDLPVSTYYWVVEFGDVYRKQNNTKSGSVTLLR